MQCALHVVAWKGLFCLERKKLILECTIHCLYSIPCILFSVVLFTGINDPYSLISGMKESSSF